MIDTNEDRSWVPVSSFRGTLESNNRTIDNLWVNVNSRSAGLFGSTSGTTEIRNVRIISGPIHSSSPLSYSGGLVGGSFCSGGSVNITNGYWNNSLPQSVDGGTTNRSPKGCAGASGATGLTLTQLEAIAVSTTSTPSPSGLPHSATDNTKAWDT